MRPFFPLLIILLLSGVTACDQDMVYDEFMSTKDGQWGWHNKALFDVAVDDSTSLHNIYIQVRHTIEYPMSNLYMFVELKSPAGKQVRDTVNMILAAPDGKWTGTGTGKYRELRLLYREQILFKEAGSYHFSLEQAMRKSKLPVTEVGLRIERINP